MFHVLTEKSVPDVLFSGHTTSRIGGVHQKIQSDSNNVMCGASVGNRREAISYKNFNKYCNDGKLRIDQLCSAGAKRLRIDKPKRERKQ